MIGKNELEAAIQIWKNYLENKSFIEEKMAKYDTNRSGKLELDQVGSGCLMSGPMIAVVRGMRVESVHRKSSQAHKDVEPHECVCTCAPTVLSINLTLLRLYVLWGQLKALLTELNDGKPVKDEEVRRAQSRASRARTAAAALPD